MPLDPNLGPPVGPTGPVPAKYAIVGEAPGENEVTLGRPFVGSSGNILRSLLANAGLNPDSCYITNVFRQRPPGNNVEYFSPEFLQACSTELLEELSAVQPQIILALGATALQALTGKTGISAWRGSILTTPTGLRVLPSFHPAYILRCYEDKPILQFDIKRFVAEGAKPTALPEPKFQLAPTFDETISTLQTLHYSPRVAFDIETSSRHVRCLGLCGKSPYAICIPFLSGYGPRMRNYWTEEQEYDILWELYRLFTNPKVQLVGQNVQYDTIVLASEFGLDFANLYMDTMVAHHTCYPELPKGLDFLASIYTRWPYWSDYQRNDDEALWRYNCYDVVATLEVSYALDKELERWGQTEFFHNHRQPLVRALLNVQTRGLLVDATKREEMRKDFIARRDQALAAIRTIVGQPDFNPASPVQMKRLLYTDWKLSPCYAGRGPDKKVSTNETALNHLLTRYPSRAPFLQACLEFRETTKMLGTYFDQPLSSDGRIFTSFNAAGTVTRRLTSSEYGYALAEILPSTNLQNCPRGPYRTLFPAPEGWSVIKADLSQAEFRIVCWLARIERLIAKYASGEPFDIHTWVAQRIFGREVISKDERNLAKNGVYGGNYKMSPKKASVVWKVPLAVATKILDGYLKALPEIPRWWSEVDNTLRQTRRIISPTGGQRIFFGRPDDELLRSALSHSCQSIVSDIINRALVLCETTFPRDECCVVLQVHDELVFYCQTPLVPTYIPRIRAAMEWSIDVPGVRTPMIIPADIASGPTWGTCGR